MKIKYFLDTDTALVEFREGPIIETVEINEDCCVDLDGAGRIISMTIEHAKELASIKELSFKEIDHSPA